jgi:hypothetical protein
MAASAKIRWKRISEAVRELKESLAPLEPQKARLRIASNFAIDKDGGFNVGGKAELDVVALVDGVPVSVEGGVRQQHDTQGKSDFELEIEFDKPDPVYITGPAGDTPVIIG